MYVVPNGWPLWAIALHLMSLLMLLKAKKKKKHVFKAAGVNIDLFCKIVGFLLHAMEYLARIFMELFSTDPECFLTMFEDSFSAPLIYYHSNQFSHSFSCTDSTAAMRHSVGARRVRLWRISQAASRNPSTSKTHLSNCLCSC